ncbi:MAG: flagellar protein FlgN [Zoogloeaceae bacterium]|nr:flagellar protein FlgN [Zoogloeaceae bacterium]
MSDFARLVAAEIAAVGDFIKLLGEEAAVLQAGDAKGLESLILAKERQAGKLQKIGEERDACLAALGVGQNAPAVEAWLARQDDPRLREAWRDLMQLAREARELNQANGQCIALLSRDVRAKIDVLTGRSAENELYGQKGRSSPFSPVNAGRRIRDSV